ncbi:unnamed protein product, partial [Ectocarpus sp. 6 AP-2014]
SKVKVNSKPRQALNRLSTAVVRLAQPPAAAAAGGGRPHDQRELVPPRRDFVLIAVHAAVVRPLTSQNRERECRGFTEAGLPQSLGGGLQLHTAIFVSRAAIFFFSSSSGWSRSARGRRRR